MCADGQRQKSKRSDLVRLYEQALVSNVAGRNPLGKHHMERFGHHMHTDLSEYPPPTFIFTSCQRRWCIS